MKLQDTYQKAIKFAGEKHGNQKIPGSKASYLVHLSNVAMEVMIAARHTDNFDVNFAIQVALLHDTIEDTSTSFDQVEVSFGPKIAKAVLALSKDESLPADKRIPDSLERILLQPKEVWAVKLADRITNMQKPPSHWNKNKIIDYHSMAKLILLKLENGNAYLEQRLSQKIITYEAFL